MTDMSRIRFIALLAIVPGLLSIKEGGSVLLGLTTKPYTLLPWLLWYNVLVGFGAVLVGIGIWKRLVWADRQSATILVLHGLVLLLLVVLFAFKQPVAVISIAAMAVRTALWAGIVVLVRKLGHRPG